MKRHLSNKHTVEAPAKKGTNSPPRESPMSPNPIQNAGWSKEALAPTWIRMLGIPGCGKSRLIDELSPILKNDGWTVREVFSTLLTYKTAKSMQKNPNNIFMAQEEIIRNYDNTLTLLERNPPEGLEHQVLVIEHTSIELIYAFTNAYFHTKVITYEQYELLVDRLRRLKSRRHKLTSRKYQTVCLVTFQISKGDAIDNVRKRNRPGELIFLAKYLEWVDTFLRVDINSMLSRKNEVISNIAFEADKSFAAEIIAALKEHKIRGKEASDCGLPLKLFVHNPEQDTLIEIMSDETEIFSVQLKRNVK